MTALRSLGSFGLIYYRVKLKTDCASDAVSCDAIWLFVRCWSPSSSWLYGVLLLWRKAAQLMASQATTSRLLYCQPCRQPTHLFMGHVGVRALHTRG